MVKLFDNDSYISINFTSNNVKSTSKGNIEFQDDYVNLCDQTFILLISRL